MIFKKPGEWVFYREKIVLFTYYLWIFMKLQSLSKKHEHENSENYKFKKLISAYMAGSKTDILAW